MRGLVRILAHSLLTVEHVARSIDEHIVIRRARRACGKLDVFVGDVAVDLGIARGVRIGVGRFVLHVLRLDVRVVELDIARGIAACILRRELQHIVRRLRINRALHVHRAVIRLAVILRRVKTDDDLLLADITRKTGGWRCKTTGIDVAVVSRIRARKLDHT